nr:MAG TPA: hypothetical protein [Caudoviricetes sp.]
MIFWCLRNKHFCKTVNFTNYYVEFWELAKSLI